MWLDEMNFTISYGLYDSKKLGDDSPQQSRKFYQHFLTNKKSHAP